MWCRAWGRVCTGPPLTPHLGCCRTCPSPCEVPPAYQLSDLFQACVQRTETFCRAVISFLEETCWLPGPLPGAQAPQSPTFSRDPAPTGTISSPGEEASLSPFLAKTLCLCPDTPKGSGLWEMRPKSLAGCPRVLCPLRQGAQMGLLFQPEVSHMVGTVGLEDPKVPFHSFLRSCLRVMNCWAG